MKKIYVLLFVLTVFLSSCSSGGGSGESGESVTILGYLPVTNLEDAGLRLFEVGNDKFGLPNNTVNAMAQNINDANTRIYVMAGSGNIDHTNQPYSQNYLIKDFTKGYQYKITKGKAEIINQGTAKVSCYTGDKPVNPDAADPSKCEDMANPEVISDFLVKGIRENKTSKYVLFISTHGGGITGMGYPNYLNIDAEAFKKALELVRVKLDNPYFKFDTIILNSCLMGNVDFMYAAKDYANYFIGSESTQPVAAWDFAPYIQAIGAGQDSIAAGKALMDKYMENISKGITGSTISMVDLSKVEAVSTAFDNMASVLITNYDKGGESKVKTSNNVFLSAYNSLLYDNAQSDIHSFAERLGYNDAYYTDDYTANKQELQEAVKNAVIYSYSNGEYAESQGISFSVFVELYAGAINGLIIPNSGFAPKYIEFMKKISKELFDASKQISNTTITESYNNGIEYTVKTPVAITNATLDVGSFDTANQNNNRVGTLTDIKIPDPVYDAAQNQFIYTLNFGDPQNGTIFTLNNNPIRVKNISFFNKDRKVLYYKTTETQCVDIDGDIDICDIVFSYDTTTKAIKLNNLIIYGPPSEDPTQQRTPVNVGFSFLQNLNRILIEPLNDGSVQAKAANSEDTVPTYDIQLDKSQPYGGLNIQASTYSIDAGKTGKFRLAFNSVANIGRSNMLNTSTWKTLDEIKQTQAQP